MVKYKINSWKYWSHREDQCLDGRELQEVSLPPVFRQSGNVHLSGLLRPGPGQLRHHLGECRHPGQEELLVFPLQINWFVFSGNLLVEVKRKELIAAQQTEDKTKKED